MAAFCNRDLGNQETNGIAEGYRSTRKAQLNTDKSRMQLRRPDRLVDQLLHCIFRHFQVHIPVCMNLLQHLSACMWPSVLTTTYALSTSKANPQD